MSVDWEARRVNDTTCELRNTGTELATGVTVARVGVEHDISPDRPQGASVPARHSVEFRIWFKLEQEPTPTELRVTWDGCTGPATVPIT
ncbi:hypothetical protein QOM21_23965 [Streptomyces sp. Pv4-95]|uniref:hypothetical protein n=1 Tax=Streptomyces sp. Pv4-95 TaxID=3049543 RepID=UPI003891BA56